MQVAWPGWSGSGSDPAAARSAPAARTRPAATHTHPSDTTTPRRTHQSYAQVDPGMSRVDQDHIPAVLQQVKRTPPVIPRGLQHHQRHLLGNQPVPQLQQCIRGRGKRTDLLATRPTATRVGVRTHALRSFLPISNPAHRSWSSSTKPSPDETTDRPHTPSGGTTGPKSLVRVLTATIDSSCRWSQHHSDSTSSRHHSTIGVPDERGPIFPPPPRPSAAAPVTCCFDFLE